MVNTHLPLNMMNLVIREVECDTCDGSPRRSVTFLSVLAFELDAFDVVTILFLI